VACGVCCVLPFALPAALLAGSGGILAWLAGAQSWMTIVATAAVVGAWLWIWIQSFRTKRRAAPSTILTMTGATLLADAALAWPRLEPLVFALVGELRPASMSNRGFRRPQGYFAATACRAKTSILLLSLR
jgi:hypothetical protein